MSDFEAYLSRISEQVTRLYDGARQKYDNIRLPKSYLFDIGEEADEDEEDTVVGDPEDTMRFPPHRSKIGGIPASITLDDRLKPKKKV